MRDIDCEIGTGASAGPTPDDGPRSFLTHPATQLPSPPGFRRSTPFPRPPPVWGQTSPTDQVLRGRTAPLRTDPARVEEDRPTRPGKRQVDAWRRVVP